jgi:hypothetical protein
MALPAAFTPQSTSFRCRFDRLGDPQALGFLPCNEEERRKEAERRRLERERLERLEKARVGRLLAQAKALREAQEIRAYVSAVRDRQATLDDPLSEADFKNWADWALSQADRIDPILSGSFRTVKWTIEAGQQRLILEASADGATAWSNAADPRK